MTKMEIRNFAYDTIANYLFENHSDFGYHFYDAIRLGGTIEDAVESYLKENYEKLTPEAVASFAHTAMQWDATFSEKNKIFALSCDILADAVGVMFLFGIETLTEFTNIRDNMKEGFITLEECAYKISDKIKDTISRPSLHTIDMVLELVGLPKFVDCVDTRDICVLR